MFGMINYYCKFIPRRATLFEPLHRLLRKGQDFEWTDEQESAFCEAKEALQSTQILTYYDPSKPLLLSCDASPYGIGAVLSHRMPNGEERPIGYVSRSLSKAEKGYSQLEKEGLALIFAVRRFHKYIYGRQFTLVTDHKPLTSIFNEQKAVPTLSSARIQRWSLILAAYQYTLKYKRGQDNGNADAFSRLPLTQVQETEPLPELVHLMEAIDASPLTAADIRGWTTKDPVLSRVSRYLLTGWPEKIDDITLKPYSQRRNEFSIMEGCVLWGSRVVVPPPGRELILKELHEGHPGISRMKALGRMFVWWPGFDQDVEDTVNSCQSCQVQQNAPAPAPLHPWAYPDRPWSRLHVDYAGPFLGRMFLVIVDAHSKWIEVLPVSAANANQTIAKLRTVFAVFGIPETIVSDNGTTFVNELFESFTRMNGIKHIRVAPYHPASNGLAERAVQVFKRSMKHYTDGDIETRLARFLLAYRRTPQSTTGVSPAELLMGRRLRSRLDRVFPDSPDNVLKKQQSQKTQHDKNVKLRNFEVGTSVYVSTPNKSVLAGEITGKSGPVSYSVLLKDGRRMKRHVDHIRNRRDTDGNLVPDQTAVPDQAPHQLPQSPSPAVVPPIPETPAEDPSMAVTTASSPVLRRSSRSIKPPERLTF